VEKERPFREVGKERKSVGQQKQKALSRQSQPSKVKSMVPVPKERARRKRQSSRERAKPAKRRNSQPKCLRYGVDHSYDTFSGRARREDPERSTGRGRSKGPNGCTRMRSAVGFDGVSISNQLQRVRSKGTIFARGVQRGILPCGKPKHADSQNYRARRRPSHRTLLKTRKNGGIQKTP